MITVLHVDDQPMWLDSVANQLQTVTIHGTPQPVEVLCRVTVPEGMAVVVGTDQRMKQLAGQGLKLDAVILDLMIEGGTREDLRCWLESVRELAALPRDQLTEASPLALAQGPLKDTLRDLDRRCPVMGLGRRAAANGAKVLIFTNAQKFLPPEELDLETERRLLMAACAAEDYIVKIDEDWWAKLASSLTRLLAAPSTE